MTARLRAVDRANAFKFYYSSDFESATERGETPNRGTRRRPTAGRSSTPAPGARVRLRANHVRGGTGDESHDATHRRGVVRERDIITSHIRLTNRAFETDYLPVRGFHPANSDELTKTVGTDGDANRGRQLQRDRPVVVTLRTGELHPDPGLGVARSLGHLGVALTAVRAGGAQGTTPRSAEPGDSSAAMRTALPSSTRGRRVVDRVFIGRVARTAGWRTRVSRRRRDGPLRRTRRRLRLPAEGGGRGAARWPFG